MLKKLGLHFYELTRSRGEKNKINMNPATIQGLEVKGKLKISLFNVSRLDCIICNLYH